MRSLPIFVAACFCCCASIVSAHDTWVETNTQLARTGDAVHIDLKLGNHGNEHRDFKLASKTTLDGCQLEVIGPDGKKFDLRDRLNDVGYAPNEGYWTGKYVGTASGIYTVSHTLDKVVNHGQPVRSIKSGKAFFVLSPTLDKVVPIKTGFEKPLGHAFEIVPLSNPVTPMGPGVELRVQVIFRGKPMAGTKVSFIPRGETLSKGMDANYERMTNEQGIASFTPKTGNYFLVVAHHKSPDEKAAEYNSTAYSATLTVLVPEICPCCAE
ncbi:MAG: Nickel uptake substrate-specific transrane region [Planctomycetaceae bacterium]|nr:Nickel uptake substrate-specific transrane region [Planctomycetaceae bacterium]